MQDTLLFARNFSGKEYSVFSKIYLIAMGYADCKTTFRTELSHLERER